MSDCRILYGTSSEHTRVEVNFYTRQWDRQRACTMEVVLFPTEAVVATSNIAYSDYLLRQLIGAYQEDIPLEVVIVNEIRSTLTQLGWKSCAEDVSGQIRKYIARNPNYSSKKRTLFAQLEIQLKHYFKLEYEGGENQPTDKLYQQRVELALKECKANINKAIETFNAKEDKKKRTARAKKRAPQIGLFTQKYTPNRILCETLILFPLDEALSYMGNEYERLSMNSGLGEWLYEICNDKGSVQNSEFLEPLLRGNYSLVAEQCLKYIRTKSPCGNFTRLAELKEACDFLEKHRNSIPAIMRRCVDLITETEPNPVFSSLSYTGTLPISSSTSAGAKIQFNWNVNISEEYRLLAKLEQQSRQQNKSALNETVHRRKGDNYFREKYVWGAVKLILSELFANHYKQELHDFLEDTTSKRFTPPRWTPTRNDFCELWLKRFPWPPLRKTKVTASDSKVKSMSIIFLMSKYMAAEWGERSSLSDKVPAFLRQWGLDWIPAANPRKKKEETKDG